MSSSNLVRLGYVAEVTYNTDPGGTLQEIPRQSSNLTGTPSVSKSTTIRSNRSPGGQVVSGIDVAGTINTELSYSTIHNDFILFASGASAWSTPFAQISAASGIVINTGTNTVSDATANFVTSGVSVGDVIKFSGFTGTYGGNDTTANNGRTAYVTSVATTSLGVILDRNCVTTDATTGAAAKIDECPYVQPGSTKHSVTLLKDYTDLTNKGVRYSGCLVNQLDLSASYGGQATINYGLLGATSDPYSSAHGRTVTAAPAESYVSATLGAVTIALDNAAITFCAESLSLSITNGLTPQNCLGSLTKSGYSLGTADATVSINGYFSDANFAYLDKILDQTQVPVFFTLINNSLDGYAFFVNAQFTGDQPDAGGENQQLMLNLSGQSAVDSTLSTNYRIYKIT